MNYILYSPAHDIEINGKKYKCDERALFSSKIYKDRRYIKSVPCFEENVELPEIKTLKDAKREQKRLFEYCGDIFEIHELINGKNVGKVIK